MEESLVEKQKRLARALQEARETESPEVKLSKQTEDLINRFNYHAPKDEETKEAHEKIRNECLKFSSYLVSLVPPGREQALALTKLEEVMFWANAGIARAK